MGDINMAKVPAGYGHKATSDSFSGANSVTIYHSREEDDFYVVFRTELNEDVGEVGVYLTKVEIELFIQSGNDALEMVHG